MRRSIILITACLLVAPALVSSAAAHAGTPETELPQVQDNEYQERGILLPTQGGPEDIGQILDPIEGEVAAVSLAVLPGGDLLYYSGAEADQTRDGPTDLHFISQAHPKPAESRVMSLDTVTEDHVQYDVRTPTPSHGGPADIFCSGITLMSNGNALAPGATHWHTLDEDPPNNLYTPLKGGEQTLLYDPAHEDAAPGDQGGSWHQTDDMAQPRWYPSALQLPSGDALVASGVQTLFFPNTYNTLLETFDPTTETWTVHDDIGLEIADGATVPQNTLPQTPNTGLAFIDETHQGLPNLPMYPRLHVLPGGPHQGDVLYAANGDVWAPFGHHPNQPLFGHMQTLDLDEGHWTLHETSPFNLRNLGASVPLMVDAENPEPRYLSFGGTLHQSTLATDTAEIIDASQDTVTSHPTDSMDLPRWTANGVLLPDGSVIAAGGSVFDNVMAFSAPTMGPLNLERFVPDETGTDGEWERLPGMEDVRAYHSSAVLLDDGRVLLGGHVPLPAFHDAQRTHMNPQHVDTTFEIYEPAYLHHEDEDRPRILVSELGPRNPAHAPAEDASVDLTASFGDTIEVPVENLDEGLDSVVLMKPGSATHQFTADQMGITVSASVVDQGQGASVVEVEIPSPEQASLVPGAYMLFVNEDAGEGVFPSKAAWLDVQP